MAKRRGSPKRRVWLWTGAGAALLGLGFGLSDALLVVLGALALLIGMALWVQHWLGQSWTSDPHPYDTISAADSRTLSEASDVSD